MRILIFCILCVTRIYGQDCKSLENFKSFRGIQFGSTLSDSITKRWKCDSNSTIKEYKLWAVTANNLEEFNRYRKWFYLNQEFQYVRLRTSTKNVFFEFFLDMTEWKDTLIEISENNIPSFYEHVVSEAISIFGTPTTYENIAKGKNSILLSTIWKCETKRISFILWGQGKKLVYTFSILDSDTEKKELLKSYSN